MTDELIGYRRRDEEATPDHNELIALLLNRRFLGKTDLQILESAASALRHMTQEISALRPDAQRYRRLRVSPNAKILVAGGGGRLGWNQLEGETLDAGIDAGIV